MKFQSLTNFIDHLQANGRYTFIRTEAISAMQTTPNAFKLAALRLIKKNRLVRPKHNFYIIIPTEYHEIGSPPPPWFIDQLMKFSEQPYYVGLLTAAALHGAAHQQPQVFQVITTKATRPLLIGRSRIEFFKKKRVTSTDYQVMKTPTGYMNVSTPETTALDLVRYVKMAGHLNLVATVLMELQEKINLSNLSKHLDSNNVENTTLQRLGYLLELVDADKEIINLLKQAVKKMKPHVIALRPDKSYEKSQKNSDWNLYINETIESDL